MGIENDVDRLKLCPNLDAEGYEEKSLATRLYNCIAWAVEDKTNYWWPVPLRAAKWPKDAPREETIPAFLKMFEIRGYEVCENGALEDGYKKIALYALNGAPKHAARQLVNGIWTSKIGGNIDINHNTVSGLEGPFYGQVVAYLKKKI